MRPPRLPARRRPEPRAARLRATSKSISWFGRRHLSGFSDSNEQHANGPLKSRPQRKKKGEQPCVPNPAESRKEDFLYQQIGSAKVGPVPLAPPAPAV